MKYTLEQSKLRRQERMNPRSFSARGTDKAEEAENHDPRGERIDTDGGLAKFRRPEEEEQQEQQQPDHNEALKELFARIDQKDRQITDLEGAVRELLARMDAIPEAFWNLEMPQTGDGITDNFVRVELEYGGGCYVGAGGGTTYDSLFEIFDISEDDFKIRGHASYEVAIAGTWKTVTNGTGVGARSDNAFPVTGLAASSYVFLVVDRENGTATIKVDTGLDAATDATEVFPLWYVHIADSEVDVGNIMDMRYTKHWVAGA